MQFPKPPIKETLILDPLPKDTLSEEEKAATENFFIIQSKLNEMGRSFKEDIPFEVFLDSLNISEEDYVMAIRSSLRRTSVILKRSTNAAFINPYNKKLLETWRANIDVQFVLDTYACAKYCVGYILKSDTGVLRVLQTAASDI